VINKCVRFHSFVIFALNPRFQGQKRFPCSAFIFLYLLIILAVHVPKRENPIVNRLNKTKIEKEVDHEQERIERVKRENAEKRAVAVQNVRLGLCLSPLKHANFNVREKLKQN